ncbi:MAG: NAD-glutamate dehydrogenase [Ilumatobacteraceae bacterium]
MSAHNDVADILGSLLRLARERRPDDKLLRSFLARFYRELPDEDVDDRRLEDAYGAAVAQFELGKRRSAGETVVRVASPDGEHNGWKPDHSILMFVTDDVPFLIDTVRIVLERHDLGTHLLVHPMLGVDRTDDGHIQAFGRDREHIEAWTLIEVDRCSTSTAAVIERDVHEAIDGVQRVVADFSSMRDRLRSVTDGDPLLAWLGEQHFVYLGAATYRRSGGRLTLVPDSELGEYRTGYLDATRIDPPAHPADRVRVTARTDAVSRIHRSARMTSIAVRPPGSDLEYRFVGFLGSAAYRQSVFAIPEIDVHAAAVVETIGASLETYTGRAVRNVIETLPRDILFELDEQPLVELVGDIVGLQERRIVRVFDVTEPVGPWTLVLVYIPRSRYTADLPDVVAELVSDHYGADTRDLEVLLGRSSLARISMTVRAPRLVDADRLVDAIDVISTTWPERARRALIDELGPVEGHRVFSIAGAAVPADYEARVAPVDAVDDLVHVAAMLSPNDGDGPEVSTSFSRTSGSPSSTSEPGGAAGGVATEPWRFRVFLRGRSATIAELVPILEHLGLPPVDEHPSEFRGPGGTVYLYDVGVSVPSTEISAEQHAEIQHAFVGLLRGDVEADGLNRLILTAGLTRRQIAVLRLYNRYLRQVNFAFSTSYIERALVRHAEITIRLASLFDARFELSIDADTRAEHVAAVRDELDTLLDAIPSLDDDRICRAFVALIDATVRTNAFRNRTELAVKLLPHDISFLPEPRPAFEIFVCSPFVEGVHLRGGRIARGGLRWSDRSEDFRTEVLGLVKAQMVKNAVIVPMGAKGGFVIKSGTADPGDRDAVRAEGIDRYRRFVRSLLDVTDNVDGDDVVHPPDTVIYDDNDPYLVVAADKGTATFSDIANELSAEYDFWLGDAFASGGSQGYDHKAMGITARGAWESVRRHARVIGKNVDRDTLTAVGVGDMSGDVFGNGMLLSEHLQLVAAFDHRHIFIDPTPDPALSFAERRRLFELPRSSWADYDSGLISDGGGVYSRSLKSIPISPPARAALGLSGDDTDMSPAALISAILRAPVDLLWNGGIGTYVKAETETHAEVGDRANDVVRVNGADLRAAIVGEGGNLGLTQLARVEYAINGGLIYTDAIDNSAGVDCSDHEVNIKIALDQVVRDGGLTREQRNAVLAQMTDEVAQLVLDDNRAQTLALMIARTQALPMVNVHARYLETLESEGYLERELEFLPSDKQIAERQSNGSGLRAPEFAVMIAYTKNADVSEILESDLPDDPMLEADLLSYFPTLIRDRYPDAIRSHRLRREIIATGIVNNMVNLAGISFDHRMTEDSGASVSDVARAFVASRDITGFTELWHEIDQLDGVVALDAQIDLFLEARRMAERGTVWLLRHRHPPLDIGDAIDTFSAGLAFLAESLDTVVSGRVQADIEALRERRIQAGTPPELAARSARWPWLHTGYDIVEIAHTERTNVADAATAYWSVFDAFDLGWLWDGVGSLPRSDRWQAQARSALRDDLMTVLAELTRLVMRSADGSPAAWIASNERAVGRAIAMHTEIRRAESFDLTTLSVALRQLRNLTLTAVVPPDL